MCQSLPCRGEDTPDAAYTSTHMSTDRALGLAHGMFSEEIFLQWRIRALTMRVEGNPYSTEAQHLAKLFEGKILKQFLDGISH